MDDFTINQLMLVAGSFPTLFINNNEHIIVPHCAGVAISSHEGFPCRPIDPDKYPEWECTSMASYGYCDATSHERCVILNTKVDSTGDSVYYCMCRKGPRYTGAAIKVSATETWSRNVTVWHIHTRDTASSRCSNCQDNHKRVEPCPFCGQVHD
jgi:hypothetical protein